MVPLHGYNDFIMEQISLDTHSARASYASSKRGGEPALRPRALRSLFTAFEVAADFVTAMLAINLSYFLSYFLYLDFSVGSVHLARPPWWMERIAVAIAFLVVLLLKEQGVYRGSGSLLKIRETERSLRASTQACCLLLPISLLLGVVISRFFLGFAVICLPICLGIQKQCVLRVTKWLHTNGIGVQRTIVYGAGSTGRRLLSAIWSSPKLGWHPILVIDDNPALWGQRLSGLGYRRADVGVIAKGPITESLLIERQCDLLIIGVPSLPAERLEATLDAARGAQVRVALLSDRSMPLSEWVESVDIDGMFLMSVGSPRSMIRYDTVKRVFDVCASLALLVAFSPIFLVIVFFINRESSGGPFFKQERVGAQGKLFKIWKFRSMYKEAPTYGVSPASSTDSRITKTGRFLRKTSLDELPQLFNVLRGEMSLVGPRPEMPFLVNQYTNVQKQRLEVVPGITGLWQLSGDRAYHIHESVQYDLYYIQHRSFFMDLAILVHTIFFAVRGV